MSDSSVRGFTLLEVLVAVAILGLGLTMILSSQVGLFSSASRGEHLTIATNLARCKMADLEVELLKKGYPVTDSKDDGTCCGDDNDPAYQCEWKIERVTLPDQALDGGAMDASLGPFAALANLGNPSSGSGSSPLGAGNPLGALGGGLGPAPMGSGGPQSLQGLASSIGSSAANSGIGPMVMGMVYPSLKPMLEASIRKITLRVKWKEGVNERDIIITQYVTDPQKAQLFDGGMLPGLGVGGGSGLGSGSGLGTGTPGSTGIFGR
ncbi:MAG TPA: type II secretion system protein [Polyangiaceae bacterium]|nr:type II secretion system protein [Polyangiaceae bacterium]